MKTHLIKAALFTPMGKGRWGLPMILWGDPGTVKSAIVDETCAMFDLPLEVLSPAERGEGAFGCVPVPEGVGAKMVLRYPRPDWTEQFDANGRGVVFVDDVTESPPALQPSLYGLFLHGIIGSCKLPPGVRRLAAANPPERVSRGFDLPMAVANRVIHIDWAGPTVAERQAFMLRGENDKVTTASFDAEAEEMRIEKLWPEAWSRAVGLETAFLSRFPMHKNRCPDPGDPKASRAWPSDRTWEYATRALASAEVHNLDAVAREELVSACIGPAVASEYFGWIEKQDLPDPAEILDGKVKFTHASSRLDRTAALLNGCCALVSPSDAPKRKARGEKLWEMIADLAQHKTDVDVLVPCMQALVHSRIGIAELAKGGAALKPLAILRPILEAAGITVGSL